MSTRSLLEPILDDGIKNTHYFEGRLLTARDLRDQENANRQNRRKLGRTLGTGVVEGLEVKLENDGSDGYSPIVKVSKGIAINAEGDVLEVRQEYIKIKLSYEEVEDREQNSEIFFSCVSPPDINPLPSGAGLYVLAMSPTSEYLDYAPKNGLIENGVSSSCGRRYEVEGAKFSLIKFDPLKLSGLRKVTTDYINNNMFSLSSEINNLSKIAKVSKLRNIIANICFGTDYLYTQNFNAVFDDTIFNSKYNLGHLEQLVGVTRGINTCDVPLAVVFWDDEKVQFIDEWSVKRSLLYDNKLDKLIFRYSKRVDFSMACQFRQHVNELVSMMKDVQGLSSSNIKDLFYYLPEVGVLPIVEGASNKAFQLSKVFDGYYSGSPTTLNYLKSREFINRSGGNLPIDLESTDVVQLYWVDEDIDGSPSFLDHRYILFSSRETHGFKENDAAENTFRNTYKTYTELLRKNVLLPVVLNEQSTPLWVLLRTAYLTVQQNSLMYSTLASSRNMDKQYFIVAFNVLYELQKNLANDYLETYESDAKLPQRTSLSNQMLDLLDGSLPNGEPGLRESLDLLDYHKILTAQIELNNLLASWSGEVVTGRIQIRHIGSPNGTDVIPGKDVPYVFNMEIVARTDKSTTIELNAFISDAPSGDWSSSVTIVDPESGDEVNVVELNSGQSRKIDIQLLPAGDANIGETVILTFVARIPEPTGKHWIFPIELITSDTDGDSTFWSLELTPHSLPLGRGNANPGAIYDFEFNNEFFSSMPPESIENCQFTMTATFEGSTRSDWGVNFSNVSETEPSPGVFQYIFPLPAAGNAGRELTTIRVLTPATRSSVNQIMNFTLAIQADVVDLGSGDVLATINDAPSDVYSITLRSTS